ncbi:hypothetical protein H9I45_04425 [Polaribacter haliotis]|uniref:Uncharacterized protein n=1 Tax=Polaribacter haliotis TaxID=1888915 RepID=A0A7L8AI84_9FLAO|nr:hypothetical protein [Polaribacter haliotis]QOD61701.1 hypothetical protein H9I45_04425 [Polaribacter haliotis]
MELNQIYSSGKENYTVELTKRFNQNKKEILASNNLSEEEKNAKIFLIEKTYRWKRKLSEYCNF